MGTLHLVIRDVPSIDDSGHLCLIVRCQPQLALQLTNGTLGPKPSGAGAQSLQKDQEEERTSLLPAPPLLDICQ